MRPDARKQIHRVLIGEICKLTAPSLLRDIESINMNDRPLIDAGRHLMRGDAIGSLSIPKSKTLRVRAGISGRARVDVVGGFRQLPEQPTGDNQVRQEGKNSDRPVPPKNSRFQLLQRLAESDDNLWVLSFEEEMKMRPLALAGEHDQVSPAFRIHVRVALPAMKGKNRGTWAE